MSENNTGSASITLWDIPGSWEWTTMRDISTIVGGGTPSTSNPDNFADIGIPWITPADLSGYTDKFISRGARCITEKGLANSGARLLPAGTVLFSSRAPIGYVAIASNPLCTNQGFKSFVLESGFEPQYIYYYLKRAKELAIELASGTTFLEISGAKASIIPVTIPPLPEQHRIVEEIEKQFSRLDAGVAALKKVQAALKRYRASVLQSACEGRLVPTEAELARTEGRDYETADELLKRILVERRMKWEAYQLAKMREKGKAPADDKWKSKYQEPSSPDTTDLPELPEGWVWASLESLAEVNLGKMLSPKAHEAGLIRLPYLRNDNVRWGSIEFHDLKEMGFKKSEITRYSVEHDDLLVCEGGEPGRCAVFHTTRSILMYQKALHRVRSYGKLVIPSFLQFCFQHYKSAKIVLPRASETTIQHLPLEKMVVLPIPLPPIFEQKRIVAEVERRFSVIEQIETAVEANLKRADRLRQSILKRAFEGRLVPQNPDDEPASSLLERIGAGRKKDHS